jgi:branched-chain amino acid transport system permease protein
VVVLMMLVVKPNGLFGERCARRSEVPMRFIFKTRYEQDLRCSSTTASASGTACCCWPCWPRPGWLPEYWLSQITFVLIYAVVGLGLMLLAGLHRAVLDRPCRLPGRGRLHQAVLAAQGLAVSADAGRRPGLSARWA